MSRFLVLGVALVIGIAALAMAALTPPREEPWEASAYLCTFESYCAAGVCADALPEPFRLVPRDATGRSQIGMAGHPTYVTRYSGEEATRFVHVQPPSPCDLGTIRLHIHGLRRCLVQGNV